MQNTYTHFLQIQQQSPDLVLGTLLHTIGSVPQVPGATALFQNNTLLAGTLGGGVLEAQAQALAPVCIQSETNLFKTISFNAAVTDASGAICGGTATFLLDARPHKDVATFQAVQNSLDHHKGGVLLSIIHPLDGDTCDLQRRWLETDHPNQQQTLQDYGLQTTQIHQVRQSRRPLLLNQGEKLLFLEPIAPLPQLLIVGAGHIGQALAQLGHQLAFEVIVLDNRAELMTKERFPAARLLQAPSISAGFHDLQITPETYIAIATQGHHADAEALKACIHSPAAYIGMIGSKRKTALMRQNFMDQSWATAADLGRIDAPIGLNIGAQTVQEIAISIAAQLVQVRRQPKPAPVPKKVGCLVLAAGMSTRMQQQKLMMPYGSQSFIETIVAKAKASQAHKVLVVLGSHKNEVMTKVAPLQPELVYNKHYPDGMLSSVQCGVNALTHCEAVVILLGDQPMVATATIDALISAWHNTDKGLVVPTFKGKRGHPVLIDLKYESTIQQLNGGIGLKELFRKHHADLLEIEINSDDILKDIDTPDDYAKNVLQ